MIEDAFTFDYPASSPWITNSRMEEAMSEARRKNASPRAAWEDAEVIELRQNQQYLNDVLSYYKKSDVDVFSVTLGGRDPGLSHAQSTWRDIARWAARFDTVEWLHKVTGPERAREVKENENYGVVLNTQNLGKAIQDEHTRVKDLFNGGIRIMQLTYNRQNQLGGGCVETEDHGLTAEGERVIARLNDLGAIVDLSHCGPTTTLEAIEASKAPIACTHTSCSNLAKHDRAKSDSVLRAIAENDGYIGIYAVPPFIAPSRERPSIDDVLDHLTHAIEIVGADRVGIGSDLGPADADCPPPIQAEWMAWAEDEGFTEDHIGTVPTPLEGFERFAEWPQLKLALLERFDNETVRHMLGENFLQFWERVEAASV